MVIEDRKTFIENAEDLEVFKRAFKISIFIHKLSLELPKIEQYDLASQMRRASKSICANIAEGFTKQSSYPSEFKRFLAMALGSCGEMRIWLKYCVELGYIDEAKFKELYSEYSQIQKMLGKFRENIK